MSSTRIPPAVAHAPFRTLLIDNHDSYTFNLFQLCAVTYGIPPVVVRNDDTALDGVDLAAFGAIVVSPGPGSPTDPRDVGRTAAVIRRARLPVLGVCLGHQLLAVASGARVVRSARPQHGRIETIRHDGDALFAGVPGSFRAVRYHSLEVDRQSVPGELAIIARTQDGTPMALHNPSRRWWGVQFHPESVASEHGATILANFRGLARRPLSVAGETPRPARADGGALRHAQGVRRRRSIHARRVAAAVDAETAFAALFAHEPDVFWLDSSRADESALFSYMGAARRVWREGGDGDVWELLERELTDVAVHGAGAVPFDFVGGLVGWLDYESNGGAAGTSAPRHGARWMAVDRFLAFDHRDGDAWVVGAVDPDDPRAAAETRSWVDDLAERLRLLRRGDRNASDPARWEGDPVALMRDDPARYVAMIEAAMAQLRAGNSYEVCLTTEFRVPFRGDPLEYYRRLRRLSPAPYAAFLRTGGIEVLSASPESFLRVSPDGVMEARPMKGTVRRDPDPVRDRRVAERMRDDPKTRAENLMIADLLRNDIGSVAEVGSVTTPRLMAVETYASVHQMVTVVRGRLRAGLSPAAAIRACFPPGSMTGAPKERSVEIIDALEQRQRGVYSGALGYVSWTGAVSLSVVIRAAVHEAGVLAIGAGGAIVLGSDPEQELQEVLTKAETCLAALPPERCGEPA